MRDSASSSKGSNVLLSNPRPNKSFRVKIQGLVGNSRNLQNRNRSYSDLTTTRNKWTWLNSKRQKKEQKISSHSQTLSEETKTKKLKSQKQRPRDRQCKTNIEEGKATGFATEWKERNMSGASVSSALAATVSASAWIHRSISNGKCLFSSKQLKGRAHPSQSHSHHHQHHPFLLRGTVF